MAARVRATLSVPARGERRWLSLTLLRRLGLRAPAQGRALENPSAATAWPHVPVAQLKERLTFKAKEFPLMCPGQDKKPTSQTGRGRVKDCCNYEFLKLCGCRAAPKMGASGQRRPSPLQRCYGLHASFRVHFWNKFPDYSRPILIAPCWLGARKSYALCHG